MILHSRINEQKTQLKMKTNNDNPKMLEFGKLDIVWKILSFQSFQLDRNSRIHQNGNSEKERMANGQMQRTHLVL